jgi:hypothetical protein
MLDENCSKLFNLHGTAKVLFNHTFDGTRMRMLRMWVASRSAPGSHGQSSNVWCDRTAAGLFLQVYSYVYSTSVSWMFAWPWNSALWPSSHMHLSGTAPSHAHNGSFHNSAVPGVDTLPEHSAAFPGVAMSVQRRNVTGTPQVAAGSSPTDHTGNNNGQGASSSTVAR